MARHLLTPEHVSLNVQSGKERLHDNNMNPLYYMTKLRTLQRSPWRNDNIVISPSPPPSSDEYLNDATDSGMHRDASNVAAWPQLDGWQYTSTHSRSSLSTSHAAHPSTAPVLIPTRTCHRCICAHFVGQQHCSGLVVNSHQAADMTGFFLNHQQDTPCIQPHNRCMIQSGHRFTLPHTNLNPPMRSSLTNRIQMSHAQHPTQPHHSGPLMMLLSAHQETEHGLLR